MARVDHRRRYVVPLMPPVERNTTPPTPLDPGVLFDGDSITLGAPGTDGFRMPYFQSCIDLGFFHLTSVGTASAGSLPSKWRNHSGVPAARIANWRAEIAASYGVGKTVSSARLVILGIGTNDANTLSYDGATVAAAYADGLAELRAALPMARIAVWPLLPMDPADAQAPNIADLKPRYEAVWAASDTANPSSTIIRIPGTTDPWLVWNDLFFDFAHLLPAPAVGNVLMATAMFQATRFLLEQP